MPRSRNIIKIEAVTSWAGATSWYELHIDEVKESKETYLALVVYDNNGMQIGGSYFERMPHFRTIWKEAAKACEGTLIEAFITYSIKPPKNAQPV